MVRYCKGGNNHREGHGSHYHGLRYEFELHMAVLPSITAPRPGGRAFSQPWF